MHTAVYHHKNPSFVVIPAQEVKMADYERVATVDFRAAHDVNPDIALEYAYKMTNSFDCHWSANREVVTLIENCRSTSVGDIIMLEGVKYMVASFGFTKL